MKYSDDNNYLIINVDILMYYIIMMSFYQKQFDKELFTKITNILNIVNKYQIRKKIDILEIYIDSNDNLSDYLYCKYIEFKKEFSYYIEYLYKPIIEKMDIYSFSLPWNVKKYKKVYYNKGHFLELKDDSLIESEISSNKQLGYSLSKKIRLNIF